MTEYAYHVIMPPMFLAKEPTKWIGGRVEAETPLEAAEKLFELFNTGHQPPGFRSMSVGDMVSLETNQTYVDTLVCMNQGWVSLHGPEAVVEEDGSNWPA